MKQFWRLLMVAVFIASTPVILTACDDEYGAEEMGEDIGEGTEELGEGVDNLGEEGFDEGGIE